MKKHKIKPWYSHNDTKSSLAERKILDFRRRLEKYMVHNETRKWYDVAERIADGMNRTVTSAHGFRPIDLEGDVVLQRKAFLKMYQHKVGGVVEEPTLAPGTQMRINHLRGAFKKSYIPNFSETKYQLVRVLPKELRPTYELRDGKELIEGTFYPEEVKLVK